MRKLLPLTIFGLLLVLIGAPGAAQIRAGLVSLTTMVTGVLPVLNGGTNCSVASITCFNNITGFTAAGSTGTTSTNVVFSTSPSISGATLTGATDASGASSLLAPVGAAYAPTANGSIGYDSTQTAWSAGGAGTINGHFPRILSAQQSTTDTLTAATISTTETQFATTFQIPANYFIANKILRVTLSIQALATATIPTSILRIRLGAVGIGGTVVYLSTATANGAGTLSYGMIFTMAGTAAAGASVNVITGALVGQGNGPVGRNQTAQPIAIATNAAQNINVTWQYSSNAASNTTTLQTFLVEELN